MFTGFLDTALKLYYVHTTFHYACGYVGQNSRAYPFLYLLISLNISLNGTTKKEIAISKESEFHCLNVALY